MSAGHCPQRTIPGVDRKDVSPERLKRFFVKEGHSYRVTRELRETVVFTTQDLLADAPFSRLDFISCRNVLIYLRPDVQGKVISLFHFALREAEFCFSAPPRPSVISATASRRSPRSIGFSDIRAAAAQAKSPSRLR